MGDVRELRIKGTSVKRRVRNLGNRGGEGLGKGGGA